MFANKSAFPGLGVENIAMYANKSSTPRGSFGYGSLTGTYRRAGSFELCPAKNNTNNALSGPILIESITMER